MRIVGLMTIVCLLLLLAMIPACLQIARICGVHLPGATSVIAAMLVVGGMVTARR